MLAVGALLVILGLVGEGYGIFALVRGARRDQEGGLGPSPSALSTRWQALGC